MARGKHGNAAATRRAVSAEDRIKQLEKQLADTKAEAAARERDLKTRLAQLQGRFTKAVRDESAEAVLAAKEAGRAALAEAEAKAHERIKAALRFAHDEARDFRMDTAKWTKLADIAGLTFGELLEVGGAQTNHKQRRMKTSTARFNGQLRNDPSLIGH